MDKKFLLEIVTPEKTFFVGEIEMLVVRTTDGDMGVLKNHEPTVAPLAIGVLKIKNGDETKYAAISEGFIYIRDEKTLIVTNTAEWSHEIDVERARRKIKEVESENIEDKCIKQSKIRKANNRIKVAELDKK